METPITGIEIIEEQVFTFVVKHGVKRGFNGGCVPATRYKTLAETWKWYNL